jgi:hypothetical protein
VNRATLRERAGYAVLALAALLLVAAAHVWAFGNRH